MLFKRPPKAPESGIGGVDIDEFIANATAMAIADKEARERGDVDENGYGITKWNPRRKHDPAADPQNIDAQDPNTYSTGYRVSRLMAPGRTYGYLNILEYFAPTCVEIPGTDPPRTRAWPARVKVRCRAINPMTATICGKEFIVPTSKLSRGSIISCGCTPTPTNAAVDLTGEEFGRLIAMRYERGHGWTCSCLNCANEEIVPPRAGRSYAHVIQVAGNRPCGFCGFQISNPHQLNQSVLDAYKVFEAHQVACAYCHRAIKRPKSPAAAGGAANADADAVECP